MIGWVFPGQGSQFVGMAAGLDTDPAREAFHVAREVLGWDVRSVCMDGPDGLLSSTEVAQPAILTASVAAARALEATGLLPDVIAGHSVGEFAALVAARAFSLEDAVRVVGTRAELMARAGRAQRGRMAAVIGLPPARVKELCDREPGIVRVATINTADQIVISGQAAVVEHVGEAARAAGARRVIPLAVSVAAHSPLMATAAKGLHEALAGVSILEPVIPFASCISGRVEDDPAEIKRLLAAGVTRTVDWPVCVAALQREGADTFVEVGPGRVLAGLIRRLLPEATVTSVGDTAGAVGLANELAGVAG